MLAYRRLGLFLSFVAGLLTQADGRRLVAARSITSSIVRLVALLFLAGMAHAAERDVQVQLAPGFNLFSYPVQVPENTTCSDAMTRLGASAIHRLDPQTRRFESCSPPDAVFPIVAGRGYVVEMPAPGTVGFTGEEDRPTLDLAAGLNLLGVPTPPPELGCHALLTALGGTDAVTSVERFDLSVGRFHPCGFVGDGTLVGHDFDIVSGEAYLVSLKQAVAGFNPNQIVKVKLNDTAVLNVENKLVAAA